MKSSIFKNYLFIALFISFSIYLSAQPHLVWEKQFGTDQSEYVMNHVSDNQGNLYICGKTTGSFENANQGGDDCFILKLDKNWNVLWKRQFGTSGEENEQWCAIDDDGNIYITGSTSGDFQGGNHGKEDVFITKYNSEGNQQWTVQCGTDSSDIGQAVLAHGDNIYIAGTTSGKLGSNTYGKSDGFLMKIDRNGKIIYVNQFGTSGDDNASNITAKDNFIYVCGNTWGELGGKNSGFIDCFTGQFDNECNVIRFNQFGTDGFDISMNILADTDGGLFVCGSTSSDLAAQQMGEGDGFLVRLSSNGDIVWKSQYGAEKHDGARSITINKNYPDLVLVSGILDLPPGRAFIRAYKRNGTFLWQETKPDTSGKDIVLDDSGNITHIGLTGADFYVVKYKLE